MPPLREAVIFFGCLVVAVILHEVSHGVVANWLGDDTAKRAGRLTLNPLPHIDPFGSILLPAMGALAGLPVFGYAKPVPVNPARLRHPRRDMVIVSLAGPTTNLLLMIGAALIARAIYASGGSLPGGIDQSSTSYLFLEIAFYFALVNLLLGLFNLLPIPPLDGSALLERFLPERWLPAWYRYRQYGFLILLGLVLFTGVLGTVVQPFFNALRDFVVA
ncbi:MAG TPA: site-2 protease family protein [Acidimicrobiia bacterium]|nr:site-2 protease family protein [Acidimicrobiia bacterium]